MVNFVSAQSLLPKSIAKAYLLPEFIEKPANIKLEIDAIIINGPALVQMNHPGSSLKTFNSYCEVQLVNKVNSFCQHVHRINNVSDLCQEKSLKNDTHESRGTGEGTQTLVRHETPI